MTQVYSYYDDPTPPQCAHAEVTVQKLDKKTGKYSEPIQIGVKQIHNLTMNKLRDAVADRCYTRTTNDGPRGAGYIVLSEDNNAPAAGTNSITGETAVSGLTRADATTKSHSAGTNTTTISHQFTAGGSATIQKAGLNTASSSGDFYHVIVFGSSAVLVSGDLLTVTFTITHA